jgi:phosphoglycolate phosphatase
MQPAPSANLDEIEKRPQFRPRPDISHVVLDFDGTLSLLRGNWQTTMLNLFLEWLPTNGDESREVLQTDLRAEILSFNGRQPIHQMRAFAARVEARGGASQPAETYLEGYARRLRLDVNARIESVCTGKVDRDEFLVHGARTLLDQLRAKGFCLTLLSGTDEDFVREETELLGLTHYFDGGIFGGTPDPAHFSKERVYADLMKRDGIRGDNLLSFGDGPVEIKSTAQLGGLPVAVASDECANGSGKVHAEKRAVLVGAGAEIVIADYRDAGKLLAVLLAS